MSETIIKHLIYLDKPFDEIEKSLEQLDWNTVEKVLMSRESILSVLERFIKGDFDPKTWDLTNIDQNTGVYQGVEFATIVVDHKNHKVYELVDGKPTEALSAAFEGIQGKDNVDVVTTNKSDSYRRFVKQT